MRGAAGLALSLVLCGTAIAATPADPNFTCTLRHPSKSITSLKAMPAPIVRYIAAHLGPMADRGEFFNSTDVIMKPGPGQRFIRGGEIGERWFLWYEQGGIAYFRRILIFGSDPSGDVHVTAETNAAWNSDLCAQTDKLLDAAH